MTTKTIHSDSHQGVPFEIHERNVPGLDKVWTFYIFLHESKFQRFDELWLPPKLETEWRRSYVSYDYMSTWPNSIEGWNGGLTYYRKHGELLGHRCVELGCDYQHIWDQGKNYSLSDIHLDVLNTINNLVPFFL